MRKVIIVGATSGIGRGLAERYAQEGCRVGMIGRRETLLKEIASQDAECYCYRMADVTDVAHAAHMLDELAAEMGGLDLLVVSAGTGEVNPELDYTLEEPTLLTNVVGFTRIVDWGFRFFEHQKAGHLVVISSLAGIRGSGAAPAYNATKSFQMNYAEGLRQKAVKSKLPINVTDIRPGFVDTAMAKGEGLFWVCPVGKAVQQIHRAIRKKKKVVYVTRRWRWVAVLLRWMPNFIYARM